MSHHKKQTDANSSLKVDRTGPEYGSFRYPRVVVSKALRRYVQFLIVRSLLALASFLPVRLAQKLGWLLGTLVYPFSKRERGICLYQLELAFPDMSDGERKSLTRRCFQHLGVTLFEVLLVPRIRRNAKKWIRIEGEDVLREAYSEGRGVLLVTGHIGNWELFSAVFQELEIPAQAMVRDIVNKRVSNLLLKHRASPFLKPLVRGSKESPRQLLSCLREGQVLIVAIDQDIESEGVYVDFFGIEAHTPRVAAVLANRLKTPLVTGFDHRKPDGTHVFRFEKVDLSIDQIEHPDHLRNITQILTTKIEEHVRKFPEQWSWNHRRWKRRPSTKDA